MKKMLALIFLSPLLIGEELKEERFVSELTISELKEIVRTIVEESIEQCVVSGTMSGRANCLLYTSPSPRDGLLCRMPSSA